MKKVHVIGSALLLSFLSCQNPTIMGPDADSDTPGSFSLTHLKGLQKDALTREKVNEINLGDLHATTNYYFLLTNNGGHVITDIDLSVSDSSFAIFPTSIDSLSVGIGTQSLVPIIKLTALHGIGAQGLGSEPIMPPGLHQVMIKLKGKTKHNGIDTTASLAVTATVNVLVMDVKMHSCFKEIDLANYSGGIIGTVQFDGYDVINIRGYYIDKNPNDTSVTIMNTGNVTITVKKIDISMQDGRLMDSTSYSINYNDSAEFIIRPNLYVHFRIDGGNTVCDQTKLRLQDDGRAYFFIMKDN
jgi:hypothetical protein